MNTILAVIGGGESDGAVFEGAIGAAQLLGAHIECLHIRLSPGEAAIYTPHVCYAMGDGLRRALAELADDAATRSARGLRHFRDACTARSIIIADDPVSLPGVSASWREEDGGAAVRIVARARLHDLIVAGRPSGPNGLPPDLLSLLLLDGGRPVLVPASDGKPFKSDTVMLCWKDGPEAAQALGAAIPFLTRAKRIVLVGVSQDEAGTRASLAAVAESLAWRGIAVDSQWIAGADGDANEALEAAAAVCNADLVVMGAYGHSRTRELILGGCTRYFVEDATRAVLLAH